MKIRILLAAVATFCLTSCATERPITQATVNRIRPGVTTEADLVHAFGKPDTKAAVYQGRTTLAWFRSLGPAPTGYLPLVGQFAGGLDLDVQQLSVEIAGGKVASYTVYDSKGAVQSEKTLRGNPRLDPIER